MRISFNRMEWAGSIGDLGTLLPLAFAMITLNGLSATGLFLSIGLLYILAGLYYRVPIAVQPMKVIAAYAIAQSLSPQVVTASGLWMAAFLLFFGMTGLVDSIARLIPKTVIRGVQITTGILLLLKGVEMMIGESGFQSLHGAAEPFLTSFSFCPVPLSLCLGIVFIVMTLLLNGNRHFPAGLVVIICGVIVGMSLGAWRELALLSFGFHMPQLLPFGIPAFGDFSFALLVLVLPQLPMTMGNAVIASRDLSAEYFGKDSHRVTNRALCLSMGVANVFSSLIGGMPLCHGAGGLAAHYRFGARTAGSNVIIGGVFVVLALLFGASAVNALHLIPLGVLGVLLFFSGGQLALTIVDVTSRSDYFIIFAMLSIALATNLAWAFAVGLILQQIFRKYKIMI